MSQQPPFGIIVPGQPVRTDWQQISETKFAMQILNAISISDIVFFLTDVSLMPADYGAVLYWQVESSNNNNFELLGAVASSRPSGVFRTGWGQHEDIIRAASSIGGMGNGKNGGIVTLGVALEPIRELSNLEIAKKGVEDRGEFAKKIALNLFNYMQSFDEGSSSNRGVLTVPANIFERWMKRFEEKYAKDPNFFLRSSNS